MRAPLCPVSACRTLTTQAGPQFVPNLASLSECLFPPLLFCGLIKVKVSGAWSEPHDDQVKQVAMNDGPLTHWTKARVFKYTLYLQMDLVVSLSWWHPTLSSLWQFSSVPHPAYGWKERKKTGATYVWDMTPFLEKSYHTSDFTKLLNLSACQRVQLHIDSAWN